MMESSSAECSLPDSNYNLFKLCISKCLVCGVRCTGAINFGAQVCSACAAFFRRTIVEKRQYTCRKSNVCKMSGRVKYRKICRYCRYQQCLAVGMVPEKVGSKQKLLDQVDLSFSTQLRDTDVGLNEMAHIYLAHKQFRQQRYEGLVNMSNPQLTTFHNHLVVLMREARSAFNFLKSCASQTNFSDTDRMTLLKNFVLSCRTAEISVLMVQRNSRRLNRMIIEDGSFVPATEAGFTKFYAGFPGFSHDPAFLARITMPSVEYQMNVLVTSFETFDPDDVEIAVLLNLLIFDPGIPGLSLQAQKAAFDHRQAILMGLIEYYKHQKKDIPLRLGNLVLLLSPIKESVRQCQELQQIFKIASREILPLTEANLEESDESLNGGASNCEKSF